MVQPWIDQIEAGKFDTELCPFRLFNDEKSYEAQCRPSSFAVILSVAEYIARISSIVQSPLGGS